MRADELLICVECEKPSMECRCGSPCWNCGGSGEVVDCVSDMCHGRGRCMHDGNSECRQCNGAGEITPERKSAEELQVQKA